MSVVETALERGVLTVTLADEERRNSLNRQLVSELTAALDAADSDPAVRVIVLTNRGSVFCAGADLKEQSAGAAAGTPAGPPPSVLFSRIRHSAKPYVGRIAGHCVAGGMGLAASLDISIAVEHAKFGFTEVRIGVAPAVISVACLPKMRLADSQAAFLRGNRFPAVEAVRMGLINAAVPEDQLDGEVALVVTDLLAGGPEAIAAAKQLTVVVPTLVEDEAYAWTSKLSASLFASDEAREGMGAYLEKRPARWIP